MADHLNVFDKVERFPDLESTIPRQTAKVKSENAFDDPPVSVPEVTLFGMLTGVNIPPICFGLLKTHAVLEHDGDTIFEEP